MKAFFHLHIYVVIKIIQSDHFVKVLLVLSLHPFINNAYHN